MSDHLHKTTGMEACQAVSVIESVLNCAAQSNSE